MFTTRRSDNEYGYSSGREAVGVLELERPTSDYASEDFATETPEEARARMQKNLDKLLNYDRYSEISEEIVHEEEKVEEVPVATAEEDIRPTSTTMQFGDDDVQTFYNDAEKEDEIRKEGFKLNLKGKIMIALYAIAVTVVLALIIINSGVLMALKQSAASKSAELNSLSGEYNRVVDDIRSVSGDDYISSVAENELGMIK